MALKITVRNKITKIKVIKKNNNKVILINLMMFSKKQKAR